MGIKMSKINFEKLKEVKKWYEEHSEEYGKMLRESTDEELFGLEKSIEQHSSAD